MTQPSLLRHRSGWVSHDRSTEGRRGQGVRQSGEDQGIEVRAGTPGGVRRQLKLVADDN